MTLKVITANRLRDGVAVYLAADGGWSESIGEGRAVPTAEEAAALLVVGEQAVRARKVAAPSVVEITEKNCCRATRKVDALAEDDAEPESMVCAAYWAY